MGSHIKDVLQLCRRPRHFHIDKWYDNSSAQDVESRIAYKTSERDNEALKAQKAKRRLQRWWHKTTPDTYSVGASSDKFLELKRQRLSSEGKDERISRSLRALSQPSYIQLTREEWQHIAEDSDVEEQS
jgi:hypothetical protein